MFSDLNRHAVNTTSSIGILYDHRDQMSLITKGVISEIPLLDRYTDREKVNLSKNSPKLFALNHIFNTNCRLLGKRKGEMISEQEKEFVVEFWILLSATINEWQQVLKKKTSPRDLRANSIVAHGVFLEAIGIIGHYLYFYHPDEWQKYIKKLTHIDWHRDNKEDWQGRAYSHTGRINKNSQTVQLTANLIKNKIGLPLTEQEQKQKINLRRSFLLELNIFNTGSKFNESRELVKEVYLADDRPWVIGFSGGKDSTALVQIVFQALSELPPNQLNKKYM